MLGKEEVYRSIQVDDNVELTSLSIIDQIRLIFAKLSNDDVNELSSREKVSVDALQKIAALRGFLDKVIYRLQNSDANSVTIELASEFLPFLDNVINEETGLGRYYNFKVQKRDLRSTVSFKFIVVISKKG